MDPRFLIPCQNKTKANKIPSFAKSLLSFENIVEKELKDINNSSNNLIEEKRNISENCVNKFPSFSDQDEGFFDRSSISPCFEDNLSPKPAKYFD